MRLNPGELRWERYVVPLVTSPCVPLRSLSSSSPSNCEDFRDVLQVERIGILRADFWNAYVVAVSSEENVEKWLLEVDPDVTVSCVVRSFYHGSMLLPW